MDAVRQPEAVWVLLVDLTSPPALLERIKAAVSSAISDAPEYLTIGTEAQFGFVACPDLSIESVRVLVTECDDTGVSGVIVLI
jgi:hypothetical protein